MISHHAVPSFNPCSYSSSFPLCRKTPLSFQYPPLMCTLILIFLSEECSQLKSISEVLLDAHHGPILLPCGVTGVLGNQRSPPDKAVRLILHPLEAGVSVSPSVASGQPRLVLAGSKFYKNSFLHVRHPF